MVVPVTILPLKGYGRRFQKPDTGRSCPHPFSVPIILDCILMVDWVGFCLLSNYAKFPQMLSYKVMLLSYDCSLNSGYRHRSSSVTIVVSWQPRVNTKLLKLYQHDYRLYIFTVPWSVSKPNYFCYEIANYSHLELNQNIRAISWLDTPFGAHFCQSSPK